MSRAGARLPEAGELLAVEAIDRTGLIVTSEGAFVRIFRVVPPNPLLMSAARARQDRGHVPAAGLAAEGRGDAAVLHRRATGEPDRAAGGLPAGGGGERGAGADDGTAGERAGAGAVAAVRGDGRVAAPARRRAGRDRGLGVCGGAVPAAAERRAGGARVGAAPAAADRAAASVRCRRTGGRCASISRTSTRCAESSRRRGCRPSCSTARRWCGCCGRGSTRPRPTRAAAPRARRWRCSASSTPPATATPPAKRRFG